MIDGSVRAFDRLANAADDLTHPRDGERKGRRRRFREAVLALSAGDVERAWEVDLLTVDQYNWARQLRRDAGLEP